MTPSLDKLPTKVKELHLPWFVIRVFLLLGGSPTKANELQLPKANRCYTLPKGDLEVVVAKATNAAENKLDSKGDDLKKFAKIIAQEWGGGGGSGGGWSNGATGGRRGGPWKGPKKEKNPNILCWWCGSKGHPMSKCAAKKAGKPCKKGSVIWTRNEEKRKKKLKKEGGDGGAQQE